ncbi:MAG: hypothetical protein F4Y94_05015 [Chloroflexi bacterium]|nr:hypothetical protein [Chloroflexota bacterium]
MLEKSRDFAAEAPRDSTRPGIDGADLDLAYRAAEQAVLGRRDDLQRNYSERAEADYETARGRLERLYDYRENAAQERLDADRTVLARIEASTDADDQRVIPIWQFNVRRAEEQIEQVSDDRRRELDELLQSRNPSIEYDLLNVARILVVD